MTATYLLSDGGVVVDGGGHVSSQFPHTFTPLQITHAIHDLIVVLSILQDPIQTPTYRLPAVLESRFNIVWRPRGGSKTSNRSRTTRYASTTPIKTPSRLPYLMEFSCASSAPANTGDSASTYPWSDL
ncbi:hypothetical protein Salat_2322400 [Sesamum alatum]|uniref:Uncharacterized protein n=1 Tax=Sesamum alatum TaxID=300844 RepID=A0AAE1XW28_9LAMI|nr:hypothetical protein Salat_2322400 [Sesamum alatum]